VDEKRTKEEFERIQLHEKIAKRRLLLAQYEEGLAFARRKIEESRYRLGRLDERLGD
jgi:hypothetical protein